MKTILKINFIPKITYVFNCNIAKLIPLITSENIEDIKRKCEVEHCKKAMLDCPSNTFFFTKTNKPLSGKYTKLARTFDTNYDFL